MYETIPGLPPAEGYRYADRLGDELFVAGQVPLDAQGALVGQEDPGAQARQCLENLRRILTHHRFDTADIRRLVIYVVGPHEALLAAWAEITKWFDGSVPPATLLGVSCLGYPDQLVETDVTIVRRPTPVK